MKIEIFTEGIGRVIASGYAMRHCISFLKSVYPKRFHWIKKDGIDFDKVVYINWTPRDQWIFDNAMEIEIDESDEEAALGYPNCPNCADQASIAAPGQTVLCKTHEDEKHFCEMKDFFIKNLSDLRFRPRLLFCSCCGNDSVPYIGIIPNPAFNEPVTFAFCVDCRDELTLKQNAARAAQERIGA